MLVGCGSQREEREGIDLVWFDVVVEARWAVEVHDAVEVGVECAGVGVEGVAHGVGAIDGAL